MWLVTSTWLYIIYLFLKESILESDMHFPEERFSCLTLNLAWTFNALTIDGKWVVEYMPCCLLISSIPCQFFRITRKSSALSQWCAGNTCKVWASVIRYLQVQVVRNSYRSEYWICKLNISEMLQSCPGTLPGRLQGSLGFHPLCLVGCCSTKLHNSPAGPPGVLREPKNTGSSSS